MPPTTSTPALIPPYFPRSPLDAPYPQSSPTSFSTPATPGPDSPLFIHSSAGSTLVSPPQIRAYQSRAQDSLQHAVRAQAAERAESRAHDAIRVSACLVQANAALEVRVRELQDQVGLLQTLNAAHADPGALYSSVDALRGKIAVEARVEADALRAELGEVKLAFAALEEQAASHASAAQAAQAQVLAAAEQLATGQALNEARQRAIDVLDAELVSSKSAAMQLVQQLNDAQNQLSSARERLHLSEQNLDSTRESSELLMSKLVAQGLDLRVKKAGIDRSIDRRETDLVQVEVDLVAAERREAELARDKLTLQDELARLKSGSGRRGEPDVEELVQELRLVQQDRRRERAALVGHVAAARGEVMELQRELGRHAKRTARYRADAKLSKFLERKAIAELAARSSGQAPCVRSGE
jgi:hypothetical protein